MPQILKILILFLCINFVNTAQAVSMPSYSSMYMYDNEDLFTEESYNFDKSVKISDPFAPINKQVFYFNWMIDTIIIIPAMQIYTTAIPKRTSCRIYLHRARFLNQLTLLTFFFKVNLKKLI